jgi:hypothetical protein
MAAASPKLIVSAHASDGAASASMSKIDRPRTMASSDMMKPSMVKGLQ